VDGYMRLRLDCVCYSKHGHDGAYNKITTVTKIPNKT
jgi:hypothetical protein